FTSSSGGPHLDRNWTVQRGNVTVNTVVGQAIGATPGNANLATVNGINQGDVRVLANVNLGSGQTVGLGARYGGPLDRNDYLGQIPSTGNGFLASIWKNVGGAYSLLSTGQTLNTGAGTLEFEAVGPSLKLILTPQGQTRGTLVAFADDTSLASGSVGIRLG